MGGTVRRPTGSGTVQALGSSFPRSRAANVQHRRPYRRKRQNWLPEVDSGQFCGRANTWRDKPVFNDIRICPFGVRGIPACGAAAVALAAPSGCKRASTDQFWHPRRHQPMGAHDCGNLRDIGRATRVDHRSTFAKEARPDQRRRPDCQGTDLHLTELDGLFGGLLHARPGRPTTRLQVSELALSAG